MSSSAGFAELSAGPESADGSLSFSVAANRTKRGPVACKRCRRAKTKCLHGGTPPCRNCAETGFGAECIFPAKGTSYIDRKPARRSTRKKDQYGDSDDEPLPSPMKRTRKSQDTSSDGQPHSEPIAPAQWTDNGSWRLGGCLVPPPFLLEQAADIFFTRLNPCSFIHKATLISKIRDARDTLEPVIMLALCALAKRFVPALEEFCMINRLPSTYYTDTSRNLVFASVDEPSIESCQAAYCLGLADWSSGNGARSWLMTGIAIRIAFLLGLHREETLQLPEQPTPADITRAEEARRLFWTLYLNDCCISSGIHRPQTILPTEITIPMPVEEDTFTLRSPAPPLYLQQARHPDHALGAKMGMLSCLILAGELWGEATRWACDVRRHGASPMNSESEFARFQMALPDWQARLHPRLQYSRSNLQACIHRNTASTLVYIHLLNGSAEIMIRRPYLPYIIRACAPDASAHTLGDLGARPPWTPPVPQEFWKQAGRDMVNAALRNIDMILDLISPDHGHHPASNLSPHAGFHTFLAAATLMYAWRWPWLCPERVHDLPVLVTQATQIIEGLVPSWPLATKWLTILRTTASTNIAQSVRADVAGDAHDGVVAHNSLDGPLASGSRTATPAESPAGASPATHQLIPANNSHPGNMPQQAPPMPPSMTMQGPGQPPMQMFPHQQGPPMHGMPPPQMDVQNIGNMQNWQMPPQHGSSDGLHALAMVAAEQPQHHYAPPMIPQPPPMIPYVDMPFGDPTQQQSFHDVLAYMNGEPQWTA